ncbi:MAG: hypothetical protein Q7V88_09905 [Actinomycetota bacterium]|nr:hypothetical protein [Actinomycetota bacterium]
MNRRSFLAALAGAPALAAVAGSTTMAALLAGCGDDSKPGSAYDIPTNPEEIVLRIGFEGGFVPADFAFRNQPTLLISGGGRVFVPGVTTAQYPGPLVSPMFERSISAAGIEKVVKLADDAGLLGPAPDYSLPDDVQVMDAGDTVVTLRVNGATYEHRANALGIDTPDGGSSTPARDNLQKFVELLGDVGKVAGAANVGEEQPFIAEEYRFQATVVDPAQWTDPSPTIVPWPESIAQQLADAGQCVTVPAADLAAAIEGATQLTFFQEGDEVYQLAIVGVLPGDATC